MNFSLKLCKLVLASILLQPVLGQEIQFNSGHTQVSLIELYTSQGCSSCPPADNWLSKLKNEPNLWNEFVPVAFHVDYWDYLGWKDRFSKQEYSDRHRLHKYQGNTKVVYTPGFFLNGKEWRSRFGRKIPKQNNHPAGTLKAILNGQILIASYNPIRNSKNITLNVGILGFNFKTPIKSGENSNRVLNEDFVLLKHLKKTSTNNNWSIELPNLITPGTNKHALALWVSEGNNLISLQATGGWLPDNYFKN